MQGIRHIHVEGTLYRIAFQGSLHIEGYAVYRNIGTIQRKGTCTTVQIEGSLQLRSNLVDQQLSILPEEYIVVRELQSQCRMLFMQGCRQIQ